MPLERFPIIGAAPTAPIAPPGPPRTPWLLKNYFGLDRISGAPFVKPNPVAVGWALPQPIGIVPPRIFGLDRRWIGFTFSDPATWVSGRADPQDVNANTPRGRILYRQAEQVIRLAGTLSEEELRANLERFRVTERDNIFGLSDVQVVQRSVLNLELQRRASPPGRILAPVYRPGGGVGIEVRDLSVYDPNAYYGVPSAPVPPYLAGLFRQDNSYVSPAGGTDTVQLPRAGGAVAALTGLVELAGAPRQLPTLSRGASRPAARVLNVAGSVTEARRSGAKTLYTDPTISAPRGPAVLRD